MAKPAFPQTPSGVTDWQKVFEDPDNGLIAVIASAPNAAALRECLIAVTRQLFTRKDDELEIARVDGEIERLFAHAGGDVPTQGAIELLRSIKDQRIRKAQAYLAGKRMAAADRRSKESGKGLKRLIYLLFKNPVFLVGATALMLLLAAGLFVPIDDLVPKAVKQTHFVAPESEPVPALKKPAAPPVRRKPRDPNAVPPAIIFKHVAIPRSFSAKHAAGGQLLPVAVLADKDVRLDVCAHAPVIYHLMNVAFSDALSANSDFTDDELKRMAEDLMGQFNEKFDGPLITQFMFLRNADRRAYARHDCSLASDSVVRLLEPFKTKKP
ncbi:MAG: hypothetical protein RIB80_13915 [Rhodospirillales bacterium]